MLILSLVGYLLQYLFSIYSYFIFYRNFDSVIAAVVTTVIYYNFQWYLNVYYLKLYLLLEKCYRDYCDIIIFCLFFSEIRPNDSIFFEKLEELVLPDDVQKEFRKKCNLGV